MSVDAPSLAIAFGSVAPPQGDVVMLNVHLGCTREVSSFEATLQNWNGKYSPNGAYPISVGLDGNISLGRGANCPLLLTCRVESIKYQSTPLESYVTVSGRCWGERLFRRVVSKTYENKKGEEIVKDLLDYYVGLSHVRGSTELVEATDTTHTRLEYDDTPVMDILRAIADSADKAGVIGYDFRVAPDGKFEFFPKNGKSWAESGLVLYLPFNENTGSTAYDHSNRGNNGTIVNAAWVEGKYGKALSFNGASSYITLTSWARPTNLTISAWINPTTISGTRAIFVWCNAGTDKRVALTQTDGKLRFVWLSSLNDYRGYQTNNSVLNAGNWFHVAVTQVGNAAPLLYINGTPEPFTLTDSVGSDALPTTNIDCSIGRYGAYPYYYFGGIIDDVKVFNRTLSQTEISNYYACGPPPLTEKIEKTEYSKEISRVRNKITVYGAADKSLPSDKDSWTESLTPTDGAWTATSGTISLDTVNKIKGAASVMTSATSLYCGGCLLTFNSGKEVNTDLYPTLNLWLNLDTSYNGNATVTLFDLANMSAAREFTVGSEKWFQTQLAVGSANADLWQVQAGFDWQQIKKVAVSCWFLGLGSGNFWVDGLFFGGCQYTSMQQDVASQGNYGLREVVEVNEELCSDLECQSHAKAVLANQKDPAERLTVQSSVIDYGATPILAGDSVYVFLPNEGVSGDFQVLSVEYDVDGKTQTLEITLELGREKPLLADYVYALRSRTDHLSRYKTAKRGG